ncbi:MAG: NAD(+) diphosphatase [Cypionkella sp.]|nr:NAD(+) diphosphatase [Cypionkella sp.]
MRHAEQVTFGGSALDRAAFLRSDTGKVAELLLQGRILPVWRGKPLIWRDEMLGWLSADHAALHGARPPIFLGMDGEIARFAQDISAWAPESHDADLGAPGFVDQSAQRHPALDDEFSFQDLRGVMALLTAREAELAATGKALAQWHSSHGFCAACGTASIPVLSGWQRLCPDCGAQHFPRTDPVVIMLVTSGNKLLLGRNAVWPEGMYSLLAGFVEPGETMEAAVRREVAEETSVQIGAVRYLSSQPWPFPASLMFGCHAEATSTEITLDREELQDALWVSREEMVQIMAGRHRVIKASRKGAIARFLISNWLADRLD